MDAYDAAYDAAVARGDSACTAHYCYWPRCRPIGCRKPAQVYGAEAAAAIRAMRADGDAESAGG